MNTLAQISRAIAAQIPGTAVNIARAKRKAEKELRAAGHSRTHAAALIAERFKNENPV